MNRQQCVLVTMACAVVELACAPIAYGAAPTVSDVQAAQRRGTPYVDITYRLQDPDSSTLSVTVEVSTNGGATYTVPAGLSGDLGGSVSPGTQRTVTWNAGVALAPALFNNVRVRVTASDDPVAAGDYLIVDLSSGSSASSYPVSSRTSVPAGGWTDEYKTTKLVMRRVPAGTFTMGSPAGELGRDSDETQHQVTLSQPFYMGVFEVTQKQWERVMGTWPSWFSNTSYRDTRPVEQVSYNSIRGSNAGAGWPDNGNVDTDSFMGRLRARTGKAFDLPTESQWEYAGRAGTTTALNSGYNLTSTSSDARMSEVGRYWYNGGSGYTQNGDTSVGTAKVGSYLPNAWGLYDIHGNVWEWCLDWYGTYPGTATDPRGASTGSYRVFRGGRWGGYAYVCRVAFRSGSGPGGASSLVGFRAVLPPGQ